MLSRLLMFVSAAAIAAAASGAVPATSSSGTPPIRVTLLGTAPGPPVRVGQAGISTLVEANGELYLFDAGYGALERIVESGTPMDGVTRVFLTHLHSDHIVDLPALLLLPWAAPAARAVPLEVWGPAGTAVMMDHLTEAFAFDIHMRRDVDEKASAKGIEVRARDIDEGVVYDEKGVKITAFAVDHGPVRPSLGFRLDYARKSVVISGDTRPSENLVKFAEGTDLLIHEAVDTESLRQLLPSERLFQAIVAHHTTPEQAAQVFRRVRPKLAVYSHAQGGARVVAQTRRFYPGRVEMGSDLMVIEIGDEVIVRRHAKD